MVMVVEHHSSLVCMLTSAKVQLVACDVDTKGVKSAHGGRILVTENQISSNLFQISFQPFVLSDVARANGQTFKEIHQSCKMVSGQQCDIAATYVSPVASRSTPYCVRRTVNVIYKVIKFFSTVGATLQQPAGTVGTGTPSSQLARYYCTVDRALQPSYRQKMAS